MTGLPSGWSWAPLDTVAQIQGGIQKQPKRVPRANAYPFLRVANVSANGLDLAEVHRIELFDGELERLRLRRGDLLVVEGNGTESQIGRAAMWDASIPDCVHQNHLIRVRPGDNLLPEYLLLAWNSPRIRSLLVGLSSSSSGLHTLSVSKLKGIHIPVAPIAEQRRIVDILEDHLSRLDSADVALRELGPRIESMSSLVAEAAIRGHLSEGYRASSDSIDPGVPSTGRGRRAIGSSDVPSWAINPGWRWASLDELSEFVIDGDHNPPKRVGQGVPHVTAKGVRDGKITFDGCTFVSEQGFAQTASRYLPRPGDIIVTCVGTIGRVAVVPDDLRFSADRNLAAARVHLDRVIPEFVALALNSVTFQRRMAQASGSTAQPHLYLRDLRALPIPVPSLSEQIALVDHAQEIRDRCRHLRAAVNAGSTRSAALRRSLLQAAFSGRLTRSQSLREPQELTRV